MFFFRKASGGAPPLKGQEGGRTHMPPTDLRLSKNNQEGANWKIIGRQTGQIASGGKRGEKLHGGALPILPQLLRSAPASSYIFIFSLLKFQLLLQCGETFCYYIQVVIL